MVDHPYAKLPNLLLKASPLKFPMLILQMAEYLGTLRLAVFATAPSSRHELRQKKT
jgi:hypothetical protein